MSDIGRVFIVPSQNLPSLSARLVKLARRANKLGLPVPSYNVIKEEIREEWEGIAEVGEERIKRIIVLNHITIASPVVVLSGYEFCASIEHTTEGNILHSLPGTTIPLTYRDCKSFCDHCKVNRRRNDTFIVRHIESNNYLQVGRQCLKDFLGVDAERYAAMAELSYELSELGEASEGYSEGSGPRFDYLDVYLSYVAETIALDGWRSNSVAKEYGGQSTSTIAYNVLHPAKGVKKSDLLFLSPTAESVKTAEKAIEWCNALSDVEVEASDYLHNIRVIAKRGIVGEKQYGYAASIVSGYQRAMGELVKKARRTNWQETSKHCGNVGDKVVVNVLVDAAIGLDGAYGSTTLHIMSDKEGNVFKWNSSGATLTKGKEYVLRGTVKRHEEYKGVKQTTLSHCSEVVLHQYIITAPYGIPNDPLPIEVSAEDEKGARIAYLSLVGAKRLTKGTTIVRKVIIRDMPLKDGETSYTVDEETLASFMKTFGESVRYFLCHCRSLPTFCDL